MRRDHPVLQRHDPRMKIDHGTEKQMMKRITMSLASNRRDNVNTAEAAIRKLSVVLLPSAMIHGSVIAGNGRRWFNRG